MSRTAKLKWFFMGPILFVLGLNGFWFIPDKPTLPAVLAVFVLTATVVSGLTLTTIGWGDKLRLLDRFFRWMNK